MKPIKILSMKRTQAAALDTQNMTTGQSGVLPDRQRGFISGSLGGLSDGTSNIYSGAAILDLHHDETAGTVLLKIAGVVANSGWTNLVVNGVPQLLRASATFTTPGGNSLWTWTSVNLFGGSGATPVITFT